MPTVEIMRREIVIRDKFSRTTITVNLNCATPDLLKRLSDHIGKFKDAEAVTVRDYKAREIHYDEEI